MSKRYGATTDISVKVPEEIQKQFLETIERDIIFRATKEGFKIVGNWSHRKELCLDVDKETGETYYYYKIFSSVEVSDEIERLRAEVRDLQKIIAYLKASDNV
jgi:hypothetical protein